MNILLRHLKQAFSISRPCETSPRLCPPWLERVAVLAGVLECQVRLFVGAAAVQQSMNRRRVQADTATHHTVDTDTTNTGHTDPGQHRREDTSVTLSGIYGGENV